MCMPHGGSVLPFPRLSTCALIDLRVSADSLEIKDLSAAISLGTSTLRLYFNSVLQGILQLQGILLKVPQPVPIDSTDPRWRCFKNCLGALDGTHIDVHVPEIDKPRYRTRKGRVATNVLGGSASDSRVLHDAITRPNGFKVPAGKTIS
ncbi:hypothetical protein D8674_036888 [Pyrus ussuriensis x Pyrus communis]|uniref:DDE Tnp4 domain-containing protein n=1 Tax=Pyrus ussuriensis x Pyrus communis TaxID=2448454 RepID=A0A5N5GEZ8_9ROSA|nr:hypothetical protein D8674_036888 [Pyrus ussuriensis x Pyrus communis]